jgi:hypothetical protein
MNKEKNYIKDCSLDSSIVSIRSIPEVLLSSDDFPLATWHSHHPQVVKTTQVTQDLIGQSLLRSHAKPRVNSRLTEVNKLKSNLQLKCITKYERLSRRHKG